MVIESDLAAAIALLQKDDNFRLLRRLRRHAAGDLNPSGTTRLAVLLDIETTGINPIEDEIIEVAIVPFLYALNGKIEATGAPFIAFNDPSKPISPEITALTGITQEMVAGHRLDIDAIEKFVAPAAIVVAHNARFDRPFAEKYSKVFLSKPWGCSMTQVPWKEEGFDGVKLQYLAMLSGFFYEPHRADADCFAAIELLSAELPRSKRLAFEALLQNAREPSFRLWAENAVFEKKDILKARGYRWNVDLSDRPRAWYIDRPRHLIGDECTFLREHIFGRPIPVAAEEITAFTRFSHREGSGIQYIGAETGDANG